MLSSKVGQSKTPPRAAKQRPSSVIRVWGKTFPDGRILDLILPLGNSRPLLLLWDGKKATTAPSICMDGRRYAAPTIDRSLRLSLRIPPGYARYASAQDLFDSVANAFENYSGQSRDTAERLAYFVIASHVTEELNAAPCILLSGSPAEAVLVLRVMATLCRRSLPLVGLTMDALEMLPRTLRPTILLHAQEQVPLAESLIRVSSLRGFAVLKKNGLQHWFFAKAIYSGMESLPSPFADACLQIGITPACQPMPAWDERSETKLTAELQPQLLAYRLKNLHRVRESSFDVADFTGPARELAQSLGACVVGDAKLQEHLVPLLRPQDQGIRVARTTELTSLIAEGLLVLCHEPTGDRVYVGEVTTLVNGIRSARGESAVAQAREVGAKLKTLGLFSQRDGKGYGFLLSNEAKKRIHDLALALEVPAIQQPFPGCEFCRAQPTTP